MTDPAHIHAHPFFLEATYRETAAATTDGDLNDPDRVMQPLIDMYLNQKELFIKSVTKDAPKELIDVLETEANRPWWKLMPLMLPPRRSNHEFSMIYAVYRLMTTGNMAFLIGPELSTALHNTDFKVKMNQLYFPADTFVIYYRDSSIPVFGSPLKWLFCDRVDLGVYKELRMVYGYIDKDGDYANSGFQLYTYEPDIEVDSTELFAEMEKEKVSSLSQMEVTDEHKENSRNVLTALFNFLLYLGAVGDQTVVKPPDIADRLKKLSNPKKKRRLEKEAVNQTLFRYTYVGRQYESRIEREESGSTSQLAHRVLVRGHWRHQWTGKQRDDEGNRIPGTSQKLIWVEPYWKGPDVRDEKLSVRVVR